MSIDQMQRCYAGAIWASEGASGFLGWSVCTELERGLSGANNKLLMTVVLRVKCDEQKHARTPSTKKHSSHENGC